MPLHMEKIIGKTGSEYKKTNGTEYNSSLSVETQTKSWICVCTCMWMDQKVLKLLTYLFEYMTELYKTYTEYKANIFLILQWCLNVTVCKVKCDVIKHDVMQQWPGEKNDGNFPFQGKNNDQRLCVIWWVLFLDKNGLDVASSGLITLNMQFWNF